MEQVMREVEGDSLMGTYLSGDQPRTTKYLLKLRDEVENKKEYR